MKTLLFLIVIGGLGYGIYTVLIDKAEERKATADVENKPMLDGLDAP